MFQSISWQEFATTLSLVILSYYLVTVLLLYSSDVSNILKRRLPESGNSPFSQAQTISNATDSLLGSIKNDNSYHHAVPREVTVDAEELVISGQSVAEEPIDTIEPIDPIAKDATDLVSEIETLIGIVAHGNKDESVPLFQALLSRYPSLVGTQHAVQVTSHIYNSVKQRCKFHFELNEINSWWPDAEGSLSSK